MGDLLLQGRRQVCRVKSKIRWTVTILFCVPPFLFTSPICTYILLHSSLSHPWSFNPWSDLFHAVWQSFVAVALCIRGGRATIFLWGLTYVDPTGCQWLVSYYDPWRKWYELKGCRDLKCPICFYNGSYHDDGTIYARAYVQAAAVVESPAMAVSDNF